MNIDQLAKYRQRLDSDLAALDREDNLGRESQKTVTLDQQSVGRLSRMDALQQQAMAKATQTRRLRLRQRIKAAIARMDDEEFGYCASCGEDISSKRLDLDPSALTCVSCARG